jgi:hypothetical protein
MTNYYITQVGLVWLVVRSQPSTERNFAGQEDTWTVDSYWLSEGAAYARWEFLSSTYVG